MPYSSVSEVPDHVPKDKRKQWLEVWNSSYAAHHDEGRAFREANAVVSEKVSKAVGTKETGFVRAADGPFKCGHCEHMQDGACHQEKVIADPEVKELLNDDGFLPVDAGDCCNEYDPVEETSSAKVAKAMNKQFKKFIPFAKVDSAKREVWGIVTAEVPDKDNEVCDYAGTKPYYEAVISEMSKATDGKNCFPLREMHQLSAVGKGIGFEFKDSAKEIFMGFKVVDDDAWKKVEEGVYTGFSHGGVIVGDLTPDPVYKDCMRYTANPSEVSVVDNPCLGVAHFAYVKADGAIELRKIRSEVPAPEVTKAPTVDDLKKTAEAKDTKAKDNTKKVLGLMRKDIRIWANKNSSRISNLTFKKQRMTLWQLDTDLAYLTRKQPLAKGMYSVSDLAYSIQNLAYLACSIHAEEEWEGDGIPEFVPKMKQHVTDLLDVFIAYAEHEATEMKEMMAEQGA